MTTIQTLDPAEAARKHAVRITSTAYEAYRESIAANPPETFALIGGSLNDPMLITDFHFMAPRRDENGKFVVSGAFVYPDHEQVNYIIDNVLVRKDHYILGLWHSHPGGLCTPSGPDLDFCGRIIANDDSEGRRWNHFIAPITTFDRSGRDTVTAWVLPKGGQQFEAATFSVVPIVPAEQATQECAPQSNSLEAYTADPLNILSRARALMHEIEHDPTSLGLIQAYQISSRLAQMRAIVETAHLLKVERELLAHSRRGGRNARRG